MSDMGVDLMFIVGGIMVAAPLVFFGAVLGIWWYQRKKQQGGP